MAAPLATVSELYRQVQLLADATEGLARSRWRPGGGDWLAGWQKRLPEVAGAVSMAQSTAAGLANDAADDVLSGYGIPQSPRADPLGFAGWMQPDESPWAVPLVDAMGDAPVIVARRTAGDAGQMLSAGRDMVGVLARTAVANAARMAMEARIAGTKHCSGAFWEPAPYCQRCAVIIGKSFALGHEWQRHPRCDGQVIPVPDGRDVPWPGADESDISDLTLDQKKAINDGGDLNQVINAHSGARGGKRSYRSPLYANGTKTYAGVGRRHNDGTAKKVRLTPKGIYRMAGDDRAMARDLLSKYGYIL